MAPDNDLGAFGACDVGNEKVEDNADGDDDDDDGFGDFDNFDDDNKAQVADEDAKAGANIEHTTENQVTPEVK